MIRCTKCLIPNTRPDTHFVNGVCSACVAYERRKEIDWQQRYRALMDLLDRHHGRCIVPSSGGKDSHYQVLTLKHLGADVTVVTATTCHLTPIGHENIRNLARYARTIEVTPNQAIRARLNRLGLRLVGDISWPEHVSIFTTPFRAAVTLGIPLMFYGENPQDQYGGPPGSGQVREMTRRWVSEFGGFLGLRPADMVGQDGITAADMADYTPPEASVLGTTEAHFLGHYIPWDSQRNAEIAKDAGMVWARPHYSNWWPYENLDNAQTGLHDHMMYRKYGYGRLCAQISVDVRRGAITRSEALDIVRARDGLYPEVYAGVAMGEVLKRIGMNSTQLQDCMARFTNRDLFDGEHEGRPILKEFA